MNRIADLLLVLLPLLAFWVGTEMGEAKATREAELRETGISAQHERALEGANSRHSQAESALRAELKTQETAFMETLANEKTQHQRELDRLRAGALRVSVPVVAAACAPGPAQAGDGSPPAPGDRHEARAELAPEAAADLAAIAFAGDAGIHQLNACIDRYNTVRASINALAEADAQAR